MCNYVSIYIKPAFKGAEISQLLCSVYLLVACYPCLIVDTVPGLKTVPIKSNPGAPLTTGSCLAVGLSHAARHTFHVHLSQLIAFSFSLPQAAESQAHGIQFFMENKIK